MKNKITKQGFKKKSCMLVCFLVLLSIPMTAFASSASITSKIDSLTNLLITIFASVGVAVLAFGVFEFASALQAHDPSQQMQGLKRILAGILVICTKVIVDMLK